GSFSRKKYALFAALTTTAIIPLSDLTMPRRLTESTARQRFPPEHPAPGPFKRLTIGLIKGSRLLAFRRAAAVRRSSPRCEPAESSGNCVSSPEERVSAWFAAWALEVSRVATGRGELPEAGESTTSCCEFQVFCADC